MTLDPEIRAANRAATERIRAFAGGLTEDRLRAPMGAHWTLGTMFVHLAFWDRRAHLMLDRVEAAGEDAETEIPTMTNDISLPVWLTVPPAEATRLAIEAASAFDDRLDALPDHLVEAVLVNHPAWIRRSLHRDLHLDEGEAVATS